MQPQFTLQRLAWKCLSFSALGELGRRLGMRIPDLQEAIARGLADLER